MATLLVVSNPSQWTFHLPRVEVVEATRYLTDPSYANIRGAKVFNLCRSYQYQSNGYYVSLLASARGHTPLPDVTALQDMRSVTISRTVTEDLHALIQRHLKNIQSKEFALSIYFGRNVAKHYHRLAWQLYHIFEAPLLRATFVKRRDGWMLQRITPISMRDVPDGHRPLVVKYAQAYFRRGHARRRRQRRATGYDLAILHNPDDPLPPSDPAALRRFLRAAGQVGLDAELITIDDMPRIAEYDALFLRATPYVTNAVYPCARRAEAEGLVVIDDTRSIIRCTNKVYLTEALARNHIPIPATHIIHRDHVDRVRTQLSFPCVLKLPDSSFSTGVVRVDQREQLAKAAAPLFAHSELLVAQEFIPTAFDWRIGVLDGQLLYACKYHMAQKHWQIYKRSATGRVRGGKVDTVSPGRVPRAIREAALAGARVIGTGLYGVDLKHTSRGVYVIEINDNPSIEAGYEDAIAKDQLYVRIMQVFLQRILRSKDIRLP